MKRTSLGGIIAVGMLSACAGDPCPGGHLERVVDVTKDGIAVETNWGTPEVTPYTETSPVAHCSIVDFIFMFPGGKLRSEDFASAEEIGGIGGDLPIGEYAQDLLEGFDQVTRLGDISVYFAEVSGFNNVTTMGVLGSGGLITGFNKLESAVALPYTNNTPGLTHLKHLGEFIPSAITALELPALEEVEGDLRIDSTGIPEFSLPSLVLVGGNLRIESNRQLALWGGLANNASVAGDATFFSNAPVSDRDIRDWISASNFSVGRTLVVCLNGTDSSVTEPCPPRGSP